MHRPLPLAVSLLLSLLLVLTTGACTDFVLDGPSTRTAPPPPAQTDGRIIVLVDGGAAPAPGQDAGVPQPDAFVPPPAADSGVAKPDTFQPKPDTTPPPPTGACGNDYESQVFDLVNQERTKAGKPPFQCEQQAGLVARSYSKYMCEARFFSHTGLDGSSPWSRLKDGGVQFRSAGENIAAGQQTPTSVMNSWMNSSGHRANILGNYSHIGIGYHPCPGGKYSAYWTQAFVTP